jgi:cobalt-zinc-cadmium efflux system membrane fusion protein
MTGRVASLLLLIGVLWLAGAAADQTIYVSAEEMDRLGVSLGGPEESRHMQIASAPAEVVIPPAQRVAVSAPVAGLVSRLLVATGEPVRGGQPIAEMRSAEFLELQREYLEAAADSELAATQLERDRGLREEGIIAERRLQETTAAARATALRLDQAEQRLHLAGQSSTEIAALAARRVLAPTLMLTAPFDGVVASQHVQVGAHVDALEPVVQIADLSALWLEVHVPQETAERVAVGMSVLVTVQGQERWAAVVNVGRIVEPDTQTVLVRASVANGEGDLRAGQFLSARIVAAADVPLMAIPAAALMRNGRDAFVFVRTPAGFEVRAVDVLGEGGRHVYTEGGIEASEQIAVGGVSALKSLWLSRREGGS